MFVRLPTGNDLTGQKMTTPDDTSRQIFRVLSILCLSGILTDFHPEIDKATAELRYNYIHTCENGDKNKQELPFKQESGIKTQ